MSLAFGEPPDSGVMESPRATGAAARSSRQAAASATSARRRFLPAGKARASYLRVRRGRRSLRQHAEAALGETHRLDSERPVEAGAVVLPGDRGGQLGELAAW